MANYCNTKGIMCENANYFGYCQVTGCSQFNQITYVTGSTTQTEINYQETPQVMPDELIINGIKYKRVEE